SRHSEKNGRQLEAWTTVARRRTASVKPCSSPSPVHPETEERKSMRALVMSIAALTVAGFATPSHAAPGDILVKVRGSYAPRPGSSAATVNVGDTVATA